MLSGAGKRHKEVVPEMDSNGTEAETDRNCGKQWANQMEFIQ
jgi:hypothetical protein